MLLWIAPFFSTACGACLPVGKVCASPPSESKLLRRQRSQLTDTGFGGKKPYLPAGRRDLLLIFTYYRFRYYQLGNFLQNETPYISAQGWSYTPISRAFWQNCRAQGLRSKDLKDPNDQVQRTTCETRRPSGGQDTRRSRESRGSRRATTRPRRDRRGTRAGCRSSQRWASWPHGAAHP